MCREAGEEKMDHEGSAVAGRANRNGYRSGGGVGRSQHMAAAVENSSGINHHTRRMNFSCNHALGLNLHAALRKNHAVKAAGNHYAVAFNLSFDICAVAEHHGLLGNNVAFYDAVNAERAF